jgi:hypothetical protein
MGAMLFKQMIQTSPFDEPPFARFESEYNELYSLMQLRWADYPSIDSRIVARVSFIAFIAVFDEFCRRQFTALIDIRPDLLVNYFSKLSAASSSEPAGIIGRTEFTQTPALIAGRIAMDSGTSLNSAFVALVGAAPLSDDECAQYSAILDQRHELLNSGKCDVLLGDSQRLVSPNLGMQSSISLPEKKQMTWFEMADALFDIAIKITRSTVAALNIHLKTTSEKDAAKKLLQACFDHLD